MEWYEVANPQEVLSPSLLIYPARIAENIRRMVAMAGGPERLRPHVKTHKLPQVIALKRAAGIRKFKCATIAECEMTAAAGGEDVLLSYQPVGPNIGRLLELQRRYPLTRFSAVADDPAIVQALGQAAAASGSVVELLIDLDVGMQRTGIAPGDAALALYQAIARAPGLRAGGIHAYDGHLHQPSVAARHAAWETALAPVWEFQDRLLAAGLPVPRLVCGGTPTLPFFAGRPGVECSPGTTVLWDAGQLEQTPDLDFLNAAVLATRVISKPTAHRLCLDLGHKAVASEKPHPRVRLLGIDDAQFVVHSEEHLALETSRASEFAVGDLLYGLPHHVCPTVALHSEVQVVEDGQAGPCWPVVARARRLSL